MCQIAVDLVQIDDGHSRRDERALQCVAYAVQ